MPSFDPYSEWLSIPPEARPPNFYQLLGLENYESDIGRITQAADERMGLVKSFANGPYGAISQELLNQISQAKVNLVRPELREAYDAELKLAIEKRAALQEPRLADDSDEDVEQNIDDSVEITIDDSVVDQISPLGPSADEALLPSRAPRPAPRIAPRARPQTNATTSPTTTPAPDFDIGVEHRPRAGRYKRQAKSKQTTNLLITLITTATIAAMVMLFVAKGCATGEVATPESDQGQVGVSRANRTPTQKPKKQPDKPTVSDAIGDVAPPPERPPRNPNPIEGEPRPSNPANPSNNQPPINEAIEGAIGDMAPAPTRRAPNDGQ